MRNIRSRVGSERPESVVNRLRRLAALLERCENLEPAETKDNLTCVSILLDDMADELEETGFH